MAYHSKTVPYIIFNFFSIANRPSITIVESAGSIIHTTLLITHYSCIHVVHILLLYYLLSSNSSTLIRSS